MFKKNEIWVTRAIFGHVFTQKEKKSGSVSFQILSKKGRKNRLIKTVGYAKTAREEKLFTLLANTEIERLHGTQSLFVELDDLVVESFVNGISNGHLQILGSELILGKYMIKLGFQPMGDPFHENRSKSNS
jgi:hypothetical protein